VNKLIGAALVLVMAGFSGVSQAQTMPQLAGPRATVNQLPQSNEQGRAADAQPWTKRWYGWQVLAADTASFTTFMLGAMNADQTGGNTPLMVVGGGGYFLAAPIIHLAHHRPGAAAGSVGMRVLLPLVAAEIGAGRQTCPPPGGGDYGNCGLLGAVIGAGVGALAASLLDTTLNSVAPRVEEQERERTRKPGLQFGLSPALSADGKRGELRLYGTF
jgi:hypothetical protein